MIDQPFCSNYFYNKIYKSMKKLLLLIVVLLSAKATIAQIPPIQWQKTLGGTDSDIANAIQPTADGGYIVAGYSSSNDGDVSGNHGSSDYWIVKLDATGNLVWQKTLGGSSDDIAYAIQQTSDGGYIATGFTFSNDGDVSGNHNPDSDGWVVKLDAAGNLLWQKAIGGVGGDFATAIQQTTDGGYIVGGYSASNDGDASGNNGSFDFWLLKLDVSGNILWHNMIGGSQDERSQALQQTADGGYIMTGTTASVITGKRDCFVVKLNASGNIVWQKTQGGTDDDEYRSIQQTTDGGYIAAGNTASYDGDVSGNHGGADYWVVKLDASGNITWQKTLGGSGTDWGYAVQQTTDGGYVALGVSTSTDGDVTGTQGNGDFWLTKLNTSGNLSWQKSFGGTDGDYGYAIRQTADGGFITAGFSNSTDGDVTNNHGNGDFWVVKLAFGALPLHLLSFSAVEQGAHVLLQWQTTDEINTSHFEIEHSNDALVFKKIAIVNAADNSGTQQYNSTDNTPGKGINYYRLKQVDRDGRYTYSPIVKVVFEKDVEALHVFPNPAVNTITIQYTGDQKKITFTVFDFAGRQLMCKTLNNQSIWQSNISGLVKGVYTIQLNDGTKQSFVKLVKQ